MIQLGKLKKAELELLVVELEEKLQQMPKSNPPETRSVRFYLTIVLGAGIPPLSLAFSLLAGTLASNEKPLLAAFAFFLMFAVLAVSLPHLAHAIQKVTNSGRFPSWCLAIALDLSLVLCELIRTNAQNLDLGWITALLMVCVCVVSQVLNCWAFFNPAE